MRGDDAQPVTLFSSIHLEDWKIGFPLTIRCG
jgi:hypothetical protein